MDTVLYFQGMGLPRTKNQAKQRRHYPVFESCFFKFLMVPNPSMQGHIVFKKTEEEKILIRLKAWLYITTAVQIDESMSALIV